ncbi:MAG: GNAT family N-acetyltransferase [Desulfobulbaceae bacterium]|nr:GNAT family N-acetyltransferase [Desulfobulbaceae bacterium]
MKIREEVEPADVQRVAKLVESTGFFREAEVEVAVELVRDRLEKGEASGYSFLLSDGQDRLAAYSCYGPIACTLTSFDLYWIVVHPDYQGQGMGKGILRLTEQRVAGAGGERLYVDTSQSAQYAGTRAFYERCGYRLESVLADFYGPGDGKVVYCKKLEK